jgi:hypothetical protein
MISLSVEIPRSTVMTAPAIAEYPIPIFLGFMRTINSVTAKISRER